MKVKSVFLLLSKSANSGKGVPGMVGECHNEPQCMSDIPSNFRSETPFSGTAKMALLPRLQSHCYSVHLYHTETSVSHLASRCEIGSDTTLRRDVMRALASMSDGEAKIMLADGFHVEEELLSCIGRLAWRDSPDQPKSLLVLPQQQQQIDSQKR